MKHQIKLAQAAVLYKKGQEFEYRKKRYKYITTVCDVTPIHHNNIIVAYDVAKQEYVTINVTGKESNVVYSILPDSKNN